MAEPRARRCETCGQNLRRREPFVLGDASRVSSRQLPIDRWMAERAADHQGLRRAVRAPAVAAAVATPAPYHPAPAMPMSMPMAEPIAAAIVLDEPVAVPLEMAVAEVAPPVEIVVAEAAPLIAPPLVPEPAAEVLQELAAEIETAPEQVVAVVPDEATHVAHGEPVAPQPQSGVAAMIAPFIDAPVHVPTIHTYIPTEPTAKAHKPALEPEPEPVVETPVAPAPPEPGMLLLAVGGEPVRYVEEDLESALDELARAAREEILAVNAPAPVAIEREPLAEEAPWLAPIRKAWEPPVDAPAPRTRWSFRKRLGA